MEENKKDDVLTIPEEKSTDKVEIDPAQLKALIDNQAKLEGDMKKLQKDNAELKGLSSEQGARKLKEVTERIAEVRVLDDKAIVGFKNKGSERRPRYIYEKPDPLDPRQNVNYVDVIDEDGKVITIKHEEFLEEAERVRAKIVNVKENPWVINQGSTRRKELDGYSLVELDFIVDLEVKGITRTYTLRLPDDGFDGREVEIYEDYVNM